MRKMSAPFSCAHHEPRTGPAIASTSEPGPESGSLPSCATNASACFAVRITRPAYTCAPRARSLCCALFDAEFPDAFRAEAHLRSLGRRSDRGDERSQVRRLHEGEHEDD